MDETLRGIEADCDVSPVCFPCCLHHTAKQVNGKVMGERPGATGNIIRGRKGDEESEDDQRMKR